MSVNIGEDGFIKKSARTASGNIKMCYSCNQEGHLKWQCPIVYAKRTGYTRGGGGKNLPRPSRKYGNEVDRNPSESYKFIDDCPPPEDEDWGGSGSNALVGDDNDGEESQNIKKSNKYRKKSEQTTIELEFTDSSTPVRSNISRDESSSNNNNSNNNKNNNKNNNNNENMNNETRRMEEESEEKSQWYESINSSNVFEEKGKENCQSGINLRSGYINIHDPRSSGYQKHLPTLRKGPNSRERERDKSPSSSSYSSVHQNTYKERPHFSRNYLKMPSDNNDSCGNATSYNINSNNSSTTANTNSYQPDAWNLPLLEQSPGKDEMITRQEFISSWDDQYQTPTFIDAINPSLEKQLQSSKPNQSDDSKTTRWQASTWDDSPEKQQPQFKLNQPIKESEITKKRSSQNGQPIDVESILIIDLEDMGQEIRHKKEQPYQQQSLVTSKSIIIPKQPRNKPLIIQQLQPNQMKGKNSHSTSPIPREEQIYEPNLKESAPHATSTNSRSLLINPDKKSNDSYFYSKQSQLSIENVFDFDKEDEKESKNVYQEIEEFETTRFASIVKLYEGTPPRTSADDRSYIEEMAVFQSTLLPCLYPHVKNKGQCFNVYNGPIRVRRLYDSIQQSLELRVKAFSNHCWDDLKWIPSLKQTVNPKQVLEFTTIDYMQAVSVFKQMKPREKYDRVFYLFWLEGLMPEDDKRLVDYSNYLYNENIVAGVNLDNFCFTLAHIQQIFPNVLHYKRPGAAASEVKLLLIVNPEVQYQVTHRQVPFEEQ